MHAFRAAILVLILFSTARAQVTTPDPGIATETDTLLTTVPQRDIFDLLDQYLFKKRVEPEVHIKPRTGLQWAILPTFSYNPVYGAAFGAMVSAAGRRGSETARYSQLSISGNISTTGQVQFQVRGDVFSGGEDFLFKADFRYLDTERTTWGLGPVYSNQQEYPMSFLLNRVYATALRRVSGPVYLGLGFHFDEFSDIVDKRADETETPFELYSGGAPTKTTAVGASLNLLADTRDNVVNPARGYYLSWSFRDYLDTFGSDNSWQELWIEARVYPHVPKSSENVLAFWLYGWMSFGLPPYLNLPSNGWDTYGRGARGYFAGRIRGENQLYMEAEYRRALTDDGLWGLVLFLNTTSTAQPDVDGTFGTPDPGGGIGVRVKFNKHTDTNLSLDYGWGRDDSKGFFLGMTEVF